MRTVVSPLPLAPLLSALLLAGCLAEGDDSAGSGDTACPEGECAHSDFGPGRAEEACSPDDGPAVELFFGLEDATCDAVSAGGPILRLIVFNRSAPLAPGSYALDGMDGGFVWLDADGDGNADVDATTGMVTIEAWSGDRVTGSYAVDRGDAETLVGDFAVSFCDANPMCG